MVLTAFHSACSLRKFSSSCCCLLLSASRAFCLCSNVVFNFFSDCSLTSIFLACLLYSNRASTYNSNCYFSCSAVFNWVRKAATSSASCFSFVAFALLLFCTCINSLYSCFVWEASCAFSSLCCFWLSLWSLSFSFYRVSACSFAALI